MIPPIPADLARLPELDEAWRVMAAGPRLDAVRRAGRALRDRILATGTVRRIRTADVATFPYPTRFAFAGAASSPVPYAFLRNRMHLVEVTAGGRTVRIVVNPSDAEASAAAPYFARLEARFGKAARTLLGKLHTTLAAALADWQVAPSTIDYVTFDHLHVQDLRGVMALLPNARLLAQRAELATFTGLHPLQVEWYIPGGLDGIAPDRLIALDGDYLLGGGFALVRTPGHTAGNHTLVVVTDRGAWTISENGICVDAYQPGLSRIRGLARHARDAGVEVILNANTREGTLDQYTSMVLEKTLADGVPDRPELPQHCASSELVPHVLAPGLSPMYAHGPLTFG